MTEPKVKVPVFSEAHLSGRISINAKRYAREATGVNAATGLQPVRRAFGCETPPPSPLQASEASSSAFIMQPLV